MCVVNQTSREFAGVAVEEKQMVTPEDGGVMGFADFP